tara:strand:+ start:56 stop:937 length:882 start_codon:yes stop_codon:yes gene_type:complete
MNVLTNNNGHTYYVEPNVNGKRIVRWKKRRRLLVAHKDEDNTPTSATTTTTTTTTATATATVQEELPLTGWERMQAEDGTPYYYNISYGSVWKLPHGAILLEIDTELPSGWIKSQDQYFNQFTGEWRHTLPDQEQEAFSSSSDSDSDDVSSNGSSIGGRTRSRRKDDRDEDEELQDEHPIVAIRTSLEGVTRRTANAIMHTALPAVTEFGKTVVDTLRKAITDTFFPDEEEIENTFSGTQTFSRPLHRPGQVDSNSPSSDRNNGMTEVNLNETQHSSAMKGLDRAAEAFENNL